MIYFKYKVHAMKCCNTWILILGLSFYNVAYGMRCGHKLVELGDYKEEVLERCGEPESVETRTKLAGSTLHFPHRTLDIQQLEEIKIEEWVYNFGHSRLKQYLRFENGELKEIKTLGRGH
jgi:hypothetical protein